MAALEQDEGDATPQVPGKDEPGNAERKRTSEDSLLRAESDAARKPSSSTNSASALPSPVTSPLAEDHASERKSSSTSSKTTAENGRIEEDKSINGIKVAVPTFPQLSNNPPTSPGPRSKSTNLDEDEEPAVPDSFERTASPIPNLQRNRGAAYEKVGEEGVWKMHKFSLYETASRYYVVGGDLMDRRFRILKIDRTADSGDLSITEDEIVYTKKEMNQLLNAIDDGNKASGGMNLKSSTWGLLGFIRFTGVYYMLLITKRSQVAMIGGHYVYQVDGTELVPLTTASASRLRPDKNPEEARFLGILNNLDLSRSFYFSYSYDITRTLQHNMVREREALAAGLSQPKSPDYNAMFVWNHYLLEPAMAALKNTYDWCLPIIHGFVDQATLSVYSRMVYITIIARRSRYFAGARYLKRGANDLGYVANDVETEQIVSEMITTSFHAPGPSLFANPNYTSYVQHRGSIPLYWTQDSTGVAPKPDIKLDLVDPFYTAAALHFDNLFERYGTPIYVLNLVKARERTPRESKLLHEFTRAIGYLNQFLPKDKKILYKAWDMSRASKSREGDVIGTLEGIAEEVINVTGFFRNGNGEDKESTMQNGVARTNCIDCLDRTNAAQFVIGKRALGHQLHALGVINDTFLEYDTDAVNLFTHMYHDHGDTIAIQYGGSHLVNTMETYRKINQWTSHSRDMVESFKRYYNNSFLDAQRQEAYNLFLGNYIFAQGQPMLWDLATDYYLHHVDPRTYSGKKRRHYIKWYTPAHLERREMPSLLPLPRATQEKPLAFFDDYWTEYYRPLAVSSFLKIFSFKMNSTLRYIPFKSTQDGRYDLSPFRVRTTTPDSDTQDKKKSRKGVTILDPHDETNSISTSSSPNPSLHSFPTTPRPRSSSVTRWLQSPRLNEKALHRHHRSNSSSVPLQGIMKEPQRFTTDSLPPNPSPLRSSTALSGQGVEYPDAIKSTKASTLNNPQWTLDQFVTNSLNPEVTRSEAEEYERYVSHPLNLPLVVTTATPPDTSLEFFDYINAATAFDGPEGNIPVMNEEDFADYAEFLEVPDDPLTVTDADMPKKRYKAYRQWLKGKSLFKQRGEQS
ncbi:hypothetical protein L228DRAFT_245965 [Xylona heveae TC161]|uniref:SAC domain-containing protein n=1 Tax=Xylona heveae (strain CBS 132557 / TC161) TaxID=1328760 RepID=A0A165HAS8_XYLHT|nr:hypothetical protein L228DRAFT_245965 [Xylona heveae TC161]KZF23226.1 hypothetical protein L228DRAFT_245965 [Xylona heveae TC161]